MKKLMTPDYWRKILPGLMVAAIVATSAQFLSEHYGAPAMLMAILLGIALNFLSEEARTAPGIEVAARGVLRLGVAILGLRISAAMFLDLGPALLALVAAGVVLTIAVGIAAAPLFGQDRRFGFLTGGAVAICGASAALALAALLPKGEKAERDLVFAVVGVTVLSTFAMIFYPMLAATIGLDQRLTGVFLGATIHDVAQVVGAGFSVSVETGEVATLVKLIRVAMLAPVVLVAAVVLRGATGPDRPPVLPGFVIGFLVLATLNSVLALPVWLTESAAAVSRAALLMAIAAVGMKTSLPRLMRVGGAAMALLLLETTFLAVLVLVGLHVLA
ncbi:MAG: putative sulfate exporter family transporter [Gemmobacter sp.]|nr:putative sulfate exporter family transporter [Gemmobacter sp.]